MFARYTTLRGKPDKIDAGIALADGRVRASVEETEGNRGFVLIADAEGGRLVGASYWKSAASMRDGEISLAQAPTTAAATFDAVVLSIEHFELAVGFRRSIPPRGAVVRVSRLETDPARVEEAIGLMRAETVPRVKGTNGLCSFQFLINRDYGAGMVVSTWETRDALDAYWPLAEQMRARASERAGVRLGSIEDFAMIRTTVRLERAPLPMAPAT
ncbi:MAG TPA: antibiotic biosynthesis monooxygenase [Pseudonocardia sp.]|jgi:heme-degrading monooxygenase HmoA